MLLSPIQLFSFPFNDIALTANYTVVSNVLVANFLFNPRFMLRFSFTFVSTTSVAAVASIFHYAGAQFNFLGDNPVRWITFSNSKRIDDEGLTRDVFSIISEFSGYRNPEIAEDYRLI